MSKRYHFSYRGVDVKRKKGRLAVESQRVLAIGGLGADVIDIDTYGSPWKHWLALLPNVDRPVSVFLTEGIVQINGVGGGVDGVVKKAMGLVFPTLQVIPSFVSRLPRESFALYMIALAHEHGLRVKAIMERRTRDARYYGVRLEPATGTA